MAALAVGVAFVNRLRGRGPFVLPDDVGKYELAAFVLLGGGFQLIGGQPDGVAVVVVVMNVVVLALLYVGIVYGLASIIRFTGRRIGKQLEVAAELLTRAIPLLLLFSLVLFVNTEMWQVFSSMNGPTLSAAAALFVAVGVAFLVVRLPPEVGRLEAEVGAEPALDRRQRTNVGLVLFV